VEVYISLKYIFVQYVALVNSARFVGGPYYQAATHIMEFSVKKIILLYISISNVIKSK
jgi:hypothetical protein